MLYDKFQISSRGEIIKLDFGLDRTQIISESFYNKMKSQTKIFTVLGNFMYNHVCYSNM